MSLRPGSTEARSLFSSETTEDHLHHQWLHYDGLYSNALEKVAQSKKKPELVALDTFLHSELATSVRARSPPHLTKAELSDVMKWKLIRGKMRPLQKLVDSNAASAVLDCSSECFRHLRISPSPTASSHTTAQSCDWESALNSLCELKGIGVATATAVLSVFAPAQCPFMADEVIDAVVVDEKRDYTLKIYKKMRSGLIAKANELNALMDEDRRSYWTAERVGQALWVCAMLSSLDPEQIKGKSSLDNDVTEQKQTKRRKLNL